LFDARRSAPSNQVDGARRQDGFRGHGCQGRRLLIHHVRSEEMRSEFKLRLIAAALCALAGCRAQDPLIAIAKGDFAKGHPDIEVTESGIRKRDANRTVVYVRYVSTPANASPARASIWEDVMVYENKEGRWRCMSTAGAVYIRPAR
jgi:hypothetical protein